MSALLELVTKGDLRDDIYDAIISTNGKDKVPVFQWLIKNVGAVLLEGDEPTELTTYFCWGDIGSKPLKVNYESMNSRLSHLPIRAVSGEVFTAAVDILKRDGFIVLDSGISDDQSQDRWYKIFRHVGLGFCIHLSWRKVVLVDPRSTHAKGRPPIKGGQSDFEKEPDEATDRPPPVECP